MPQHDAFRSDRTDQSDVGMYSKQQPNDIGKSRAGCGAARSRTETANEANHLNHDLNMAMGVTHSGASVGPLSCSLRTSELFPFGISALGSSKVEARTNKHLYNTHLNGPVWRSVRDDDGGPGAVVFLTHIGVANRVALRSDSAAATARSRIHCWAHEPSLGLTTTSSVKQSRSTKCLAPARVMTEYVSPPLSCCMILPYVHVPSDRVTCTN